MDCKRASTPPPPKHVDEQLLAPPETPGGSRDSLPRTTIPPSPGGPQLNLLTASSKRPTRLRAAPSSKRSQSSGVKKAAPKMAKTKVNIVQMVHGIADGKKCVGLVDLPGEIRNLIYSFTSANSRQALLVHRPRLASLRARTQLDRHRTLPSEAIDKEQEDALPATDRRGRTGTNKRKAKTSTLARETNRPFFGLTQVCQVLRHEFRPIYMQKQEIGMDLIDVVRYLQVYYPEAAEHLKALSTSIDCRIDMPFTGNLTIAVGDKVKDVEKSADGIDVWPLLDLWANSYRIEAGFGRYMQAHYDATTDGEAKDLYRLFGRSVGSDRRCSIMNTLWRTALRTRSLSAVRIYRKPTSASPTTLPAPQRAARLVNPLVSPIVPGPRPYIHIVFRADTAEPWMMKEVSPIPHDWLRLRGFSGMEHFEVKVGVAPVSAA